MFNHYFDIVNIIKEQNIPCIISLHDFYCICPTINKVNYKDEYCGYPSPEDCNACLSKKKNNYNIDSWRDVWTRLFNSSKVIITPSESARKEIIQNFPELLINVIGHGIPLNKKTTCLNIDDDEIFNIAFIGVLQKIKGESIIRNLLSLPNRHIVFHLFGHIQSPECIINKNIIYHNQYKREELNKLFQENKIKLVCIFSICPETFSYTFFEAIANNIPVLAIDLGNVGQKINEYNLGWLIKKNTEPFEISNTLKNIFNSKNEYKLIAESVNNFKIKTIKEMVADYDKIYSTYPKRTNNMSNTHDIYFTLKENYFQKQKIKKKKLKIKIEKIKTNFKEKGFIYTVKFILCKIFKK
jgi:glycosyltransferase involved in cell wall biosynthesis